MTKASSTTKKYLAQNKNAAEVDAERQFKHSLAFPATYLCEARSSSCTSTVTLD
jgi:hypothetical protein